jgi:hypothetical protein
MFEVYRSAAFFYKFVNEIFGNLLFGKLQIRGYFFSKKNLKNAPVSI